MSRTPDEIMADFDKATQGQADIDPRDILWEVIYDILDSVKLACDELVSIEDVYPVVSDYVSTNYGD